MHALEYGDVVARKLRLYCAYTAIAFAMLKRQQQHSWFND